MARVRKHIRQTRVRVRVRVGLILSLTLPLTLAWEERGEGAQAH